MDGDPFAELILHDGLIFAMRDVETGEVDHTGRFLTDPKSGSIGWIQVGGRIARRRDRVLEVA
jgi:hypothetical protein